MTEVERLNEALQKFPPERREELAAMFANNVQAIYQQAQQGDPWWNGLTQAQQEHVKHLIQEGIDSGPAGPLDMEDIKLRGRQRLAESRH